VAVPAVDAPESRVRRHLALVGPTASGKSALALDIARRIPDIEIVSVDSMQVYRGMDVGTGKATLTERTEVPHHLIDLVEPNQHFSLAEFQAAAAQAISAIEERGRRALLVGGTGLYLQAIVDQLDLPGQFPDVRTDLEATTETATLFDRLEQMDPLAASRTEPGNRRRIVRALEVTIGAGRPFSSFGPGLGAFPPTRFAMFGIWLPRSVGAQRIHQRVHQMMSGGWPDEVVALRRRQLSVTAAQALGYKELLALDDAELLTLDPRQQAPAEASFQAHPVVAEIIARTRSFARRQRVWFRRDPRIAWYGTGDDPARLLGALLRDCEQNRLGAEGGANFT